VHAHHHRSESPCFNPGGSAGTSQAAPESIVPPMRSEGTALALSRLGFGTARLGGRLTRKQSLRLLSTAYECGMTHFDTARLYGYGETEGIIGEFIKGRRSRVVIASKVGILPPNHSRLLSMAKMSARWIVRLCPSCRVMLRRRAEGLVKSGMFDVPIMQQSLETSLRELRTDYLDILLLHECRMSDLSRDELSEFLECNQRSGKIRYYGVASTPEVCANAHRLSRYKSSVMQFPSGAITRASQGVIPPGSGVPVITHSSLGLAFNGICDQLAANDAMASAWSRTLDIDARDRRALGAVFLTYAIDENPQGCVLFSSTSDVHIRLNMATARRAIETKTSGDALLSCVTRLNQSVV